MFAIDGSAAVPRDPDDIVTTEQEMSQGEIELFVDIFRLV